MAYSPVHADRRPAGLATVTGFWRGYLGRLHARSKSLVTFLDLRMEALIAGWIGITVLIAMIKIAQAPLPPDGPLQAVALSLPYLLVAMAPIAGYRIAAGSFPRGMLFAQPALRLCRYGTWRNLDELSARGNPGFGPAGFMASLLLGLLLNVPMRSLEFFSAVPALGAGAPFWAQKILIVMTFDAVCMNFFYMVCFVLALRSVPLFPRMMLFVWLCDVTMQLAIARQIAGIPDLPPGVGVALSSLLEGNIQKVAISVAVWMPYLILSERVNVTFRRRSRGAVSG